MGYDLKTMRITGTVSRHNSPADKFDDAAWEHLADYIEHHVITKPEYTRLKLELDSD